MIPDFPHNIYKNMIGPIEFFLFRPDVAKTLPCWLSQFRKATETANRTQQKKSIGPILLLYYEESLVSSNLNSKLFWFHCVRPNIYASLISRKIEGQL